MFNNLFILYTSYKLSTKMYTSFLLTLPLFITEKVFTKIHLINLMKLASARSFVAPYEQRMSIHMAVISQIPLVSSVFCT
jgi:hypothetical protein